MVGFIMGAIVIGLIGLTGWAVASSGEDPDPKRRRESTAVLDPDRETKTRLYDPLFSQLDKATQDLLKRTAEEQGRLALGGREGDIAVWSEEGCVIWEARDKRGDVLERGEIELPHFA